ESPTNFGNNSSPFRKLIWKNNLHKSAKYRCKHWLRIYLHWSSTFREKTDSKMSLSNAAGSNEVRLILKPWKAKFKRACFLPVKSLILTALQVASIYKMLGVPAILRARIYNTVFRIPYYFSC